MRSPASFHRLAERELNEAADYYEVESPGLGAAFLDEVARCVRAITESPQAGAVILAEARRRLVARFPYAVIYRVGPDCIRILAVMNLHRRPGYWVGRE